MFYDIEIGMFEQEAVCSQHKGKSNKRRKRLSLTSIMVQELKIRGYGQEAAARNLHALGLSVSRRELQSMYSA